MTAIVGMITPTKCTDTEVKSIIRIANENVLIATNMLASLSLEQRIVERKWVIRNEDFKQEEI